MLAGEQTSVRPEEVHTLASLRASLDGKGPTLVLADPGCNLDKRDTLITPGLLDRWVTRPLDPLHQHALRGAGRVGRSDPGLDRSRRGQAFEQEVAAKTGLDVGHACVQHTPGLRAKSIPQRLDNLGPAPFDGERGGSETPR